MPTPDDIASFPDAFLARSDAPDRRYEKRADCFAVHDGPDTTPPGLRLLYRLEAESIDVYEGRPETLPPGENHELRAVYALSENEPPSVPTGRVFVTFDAVDGDEPPEDGVFESTQYVIESRPGYAPRSVWLVARDGSIATALAVLGSLAKLDAVASVEPQMLRPASRRGGRRGASR